jgi:hypothetical protein
LTGKNRENGVESGDVIYDMVEMVGRGVNILVRAMLGWRMGDLKVVAGWVCL